ncbi:hypothetical protein N7493_000945 [Penicillium malachiteum]|uniref:Major facilitator superfamily (MFS) profile domain-containing protein n=1 Tax=Penicillium malachiteum TaxID=1324776 RepID=A0AAD6N188_9EURO|nr:hypothetical protein N7493_000945 [Penicillium malachiteum]
MAAVKNENFMSLSETIVTDSVHLESIDVSKENEMNYDLVDPEVAKYAIGQAIEISAEDDKLLKQLMDQRILAIMVGTYFLQDLDKSTISFASIMGIREDTHLLGLQVFLSPVLLLIYVSDSECIVWGTALACSAGCQSFAGLVTTRTILGMSEAYYQPIFVIISGAFYKREEQSTGLS